MVKFITNMANEVLYTSVNSKNAIISNISASQTSNTQTSKDKVLQYITKVEKCDPEIAVVDVSSPDEQLNQEHSSFPEALDVATRTRLPYKCEDRHLKVIKQLQSDEQLSIRLLRLDLSSLLRTAPRQILIDESGSKWNKLTKKVSKSELRQRGFLNINETESLKIEEALVRKYKLTNPQGKIIQSNSETETKLHQCLQCSKTFLKRKGLLIHLKHMHGAKSALLRKAYQFPCSTCNFQAESLNSLKNHINKNHIPTKRKG